jgi:flagellar motor switch protein FliN
MTIDDALNELAVSTAEAVAGVLRTFLPDGVELGEPGVVPAGTPPLDGVSIPAVAAEVVYTDGASGGNVFVTTVAGVRKLAAAMTGSETGASGEPLDAMERSAVGEAMNQMMAAAAAAASEVLGEHVDISTPEVRDIETVADAATLGEGAAYATGVMLSIDGEPARLVQLVPKAFVTKMTRALENLAAAEIADEAEEAFAELGPDEILRGVSLRVCAEIGRATMPMAQAVSLPGGGLVELDRGAEEPVDVLVNGRRFATGRLVLVDDEWAVRIEEVLLGAGDLPPTTATSIDRS